MFRHGFIFVNRNAIQKPKDLEGKRIGVPIYTVTAAVYIRALLQHEYGVDLSTIQWVTGDMEKPGTHGNPSVMPLLTPVAIEHNRTDKSLGDLLAENSLQAMIGTTIPSVLGRHPDVTRLFPNYAEVEADYYRRTQIFPIMHVVIIRKEVYERNPFVATSLYRALCASKDLALTRMRSVGALRYMLPWMWHKIDEVNQVFGADPWPYGVEANRKTLEAFISVPIRTRDDRETHAARRGFRPRRIKLRSFRGALLAAGQFDHLAHARVVAVLALHPAFERRDG